MRKKIKRAPEASVGTSTSRSCTNADRSLTLIVCSWLKDLDLHEHDLIPQVPPDLDIFSLLQSPGESSKKATKNAETEFGQARGLQALRASVVGGKAFGRDLRLMFLVSLLLFIDPHTSHLRKAVKSLLAATERVIKEQQRGGGSSSTDVIVELVAARFATRWWNMNAGPPTPPDRAAPAAGQAVDMAASL